MPLRFVARMETIMVISADTPACLRWIAHDRLTGVRPLGNAGSRPFGIATSASLPLREFMRRIHRVMILGCGITTDALALL
jgi:hypothetical protein